MLPTSGVLAVIPYLLLLHQLSIGAIVDDIATKDRGSQNSIDFLGVDVLELAVEDKVVSSRANGDGGPLAKQNKGENIAKLYVKQLEDISPAQHSEGIERGNIGSVPWRGSP